MTAASGAGARYRTRRPDNTSGLNPLPGPDTGAADGGLPLVHRLAIAYFAAPVAVWLLGWFKWWFGIPAAALLAVGLWRALSGPWPIRRPRPPPGECWS